jgi:predicted DNA-binding protein
MARKSIEVIPKKRGRPATGKDPLIAVRLPRKLINALDKWAASAGLTRSASVRQMIEKGLEN